MKTLRFDQFTSVFDDYSDWSLISHGDIPDLQGDAADDEDYGDDDNGGSNDYGDDLSEQPVPRKKIITKYEDFIFYKNLFKDDQDFGLYGSL